VRLKRRQKTMPPALRSIPYCPWQDLPLQCGLLACSITKLEMNSITYVHTARKETITIQAALEKAANPDMTKRILKARTQMVESMYEYFDAGLSESHRAKLYICTLLDPRFKNYNMWPTRKYVTIHTYAQSVCSVAKLNDRG
jgi:hypothetical protein